MKALFFSTFVSNAVSTGLLIIFPSERCLNFQVCPVVLLNVCVSLACVFLKVEQFGPQASAAH